VHRFGHLRPDTVVETGVAHGVTSRVIREGLERNRSGHLWSVDLPAVDRCCIPRSVWPSRSISGLAGPMSRGRAESGSDPCSLPANRLTSSSTTACTPDATCASSSTRPGRSSDQAGWSWSMTSTTTSAFSRSSSRQSHALGSPRRRSPDAGLWGVAVKA
jgi:hypothetical protein